MNRVKSLGLIALSAASVLAECPATVSKGWGNVWTLQNDTLEVTIQASDVLSLSLPDNPHTLYAIGGVLNWTASKGGLSNGGRNALVRYDTGVTSYSKNGQMQGKPNATARLFIYRPDKNGVDETAVKPDAQESRRQC